MDGDIHTSSVEGFWSLAKRGIGGVHHAVSEEYLQTYLNVYAFRYNRRALKTPMFKAVLDRASAPADGFLAHEASKVLLSERTRLRRLLLRTLDR